jgi:hypothetical protein
MAVDGDRFVSDLNRSAPTSGFAGAPGSVLAQDIGMGCLTTSTVHGTEVEALLAGLPS